MSENVKVMYCASEIEKKIQHIFINKKYKWAPLGEKCRNVNVVVCASEKKEKVRKCKLCKYKYKVYISKWKCKAIRCASEKKGKVHKCIEYIYIRGNVKYEKVKFSS